LTFHNQPHPKSATMRILRAKNIRKQLRFYRINYGIHPPYKVLLDGNFIFACLKVKMDVKDRLVKLLQEERCSLFVPRAVLEELQTLGASFEHCYEFAMKLEHPLDDALSESISASEAIEKIIGDCNSGKYLVASQDEQLWAKLRKVPGVPVVHAQRALLVLAPPSAATAAAAARALNKQGTLNQNEKEIVKSIKAHQAKKRKMEQASEPKVRLKKKAKGPNPLSMKKKKKERHPTTKNTRIDGGAQEEKQQQQADEKKRRKRKKKKNSVSSHKQQEDS